jgi:hypothetical protein
LASSVFTTCRLRSAARCSSTTSPRTGCRRSRTSRPSYRPAVWR